MKRARGLAKPVLNMRFIVMKHNQHEVALLDEFAARHGFELLTIRNIFFIESTSDDRTSGALAPDADVWSSLRTLAPRGDTPAALSSAWNLSGSPPLFADGTLVLCEQDYNAELAWAASRAMSPSATCGTARAPRAFARPSGTTRESVSFCRKCPYLDRPSHRLQRRVALPDELRRKVSQ